MKKQLNKGLDDLSNDNSVADETVYNVRLLKMADGTFRFDQDCFMHRLATRKNRMKRVRKIEPERVMEWVDASATDRAKLEMILEQGQR